jgi:sigma-B regulation protein RsbU (phosphoserine phosphatase)
MEKKSRKQAKKDKQFFNISTLVAGDFKLQEVLDRLAAAAVKVTRTTACSIRLLNDEEGKLKMRSTYGLSDEYRNKGPVTKVDPVIEQAFNGEAVVIDDMRVDGRIKYPDATKKEGLISQLTVAIKFRNNNVGVLRLYSPKPKRFNKEAVALARVVATQCAVAITNARLYRKAIEGAKMEEQMRLAGAVQRRMIPEKAPSMPGLDIAAAYQPCFQIGGDLYDFNKIDDHTLAVGIADVIGKGVPAAMMMSMFRGSIRAYIDGGFQRHSLHDVVKQLNHVACSECRDGEFITLFLARIDTKAKTITYCNCGHEPAILVRQGQISELGKGGLVLGITENTEHEIDVVKIEEDDVLLMYTDGLVDAVNFENEFWGRENMLDVLKQNADRSAEELIGNMLGFRRRFVGLANQFDDTSVVAIKVDKNANMQTSQEQQ